MLSVRANDKGGFGVVAVSEQGIGSYCERRKTRRPFEGDIEVKGDIRLLQATVLKISTSRSC